MGDDRHGAKQPERFDPNRANVLDDVSRFAYVPPERIVELLSPVPPGSLIVDFGTGTGTYAIELARRLPRATILGLDEQPAMLEKLASKTEIADLVNLRAVSPADIAAYAGGVDRVLALNVLHEIGDDALRSLVALLRFEGFALVIDWNADVERAVGPPNDHVYGVSAARERLEAFGLHCEAVTGFPYHHAFAARRHART